MHVAFVHSEHRRTEQTRRKSRKINHARFKRYALFGEVRREECRKHKTADQERRRDRHFSENAEFVYAKGKYNDCDCKRESECNVAVNVVIQKARCGCASDDG